MNATVESIVTAFGDLREHCEHYTGIKDCTEDNQCKHPDNPGQCGNWCAMDCCPLLRACARAASLGWD